MEKKTILITSVDLGGGHKAVKHSLMQSLNNDPSLEVIPYHSHQQLYDMLYRFIVQFPKLYKKIHDNSSKHVSYVQYLIQGLEYLPLKKVIKKHNPDLIICTHAFHVFAFDALRKIHGYTYQIANVVCDYGDQRFYVDGIEGFDRCLVRDELTKSYIKNYVPEDRIALFGTLVHQAFLDIRKMNTDQRSQLFYQWFETIFPGRDFQKNLPCILIVGGSGWTRKSASLVKALQGQTSYQIFVSCGKDEQFLKDLQGMDRVFPFGFVDQETLALVEYQMDAVVLSSLAPATMLELSSLQKFPLLVHRYIEGQEYEHIKLLDQRGIGVYEKQDKKMIALIQQRLDHPEQFASMLQAQRHMVETNTLLAGKNASMIHSLLNH